VHKNQEILEALVAELSAISPAYYVERMTPRSVSKHPTIRVILGSEDNQSDGFLQDVREMQVYIDTYLLSKAENIENDALNIKNQIELALINNPLSNIGVNSIRFSSQDEITFNSEEAEYYEAMIRTTWLITYIAIAGSNVAFQSLKSGL
jgi:hypothetical protein